MAVVASAATTFDSADHIHQRRFACSWQGDQAEAATCCGLNMVAASKSDGVDMNWNRGGRDGDKVLIPKSHTGLLNSLPLSIT